MSDKEPGGAKSIPFFSEDAKCPACHQTLAGSVYICPDCRSASHQDCYNFTQSCGTIFCSKEPNGTGKAGEALVAEGLEGKVIDGTQTVMTKHSPCSVTIGKADSEKIQAVFNRVKHYNIAPEKRWELSTRLHMLTLLNDNFIYPEDLILYRILKGLSGAHFTDPEDLKRLQRLAYILIKIDPDSDFIDDQVNLLYNTANSNDDNLTRARASKLLSSPKNPNTYSGSVHASKFPKPYSLVVSDLIIVKRFDDAITIAKESGIESLLKQATFRIGVYHARKGSYEQAREVFISGGHFEKAVEADIQRLDCDETILFDIILQKYLTAQSEPKDVAVARFSRFIADKTRKIFRRLSGERADISGYTPFSSLRVYELQGLLKVEIHEECAEYLKRHSFMGSVGVLFDKISKECYKLAQKRLGAQGNINAQIELAKEFDDKAGLREFQTALSDYQLLSRPLEEGSK